MSAPKAASVTLDDVRTLLGAGDSLLSPGLDYARRLTRNGAGIDEHQVVTERVAYAATELRAAQEALALCLETGAGGRGELDGHIGLDPQHQRRHHPLVRHVRRHVQPVVLG